MSTSFADSIEHIVQDPRLHEILAGYRRDIAPANATHEERSLLAYKVVIDLRIWAATAKNRSNPTTTEPEPNQ